MSPKDLLNKYIVIDNTQKETPTPNPKLLKKIKSRSLGWLSQEERAAKVDYLNELKIRERDASESV